MQTDRSRNLDERTGVREATWGEVKLKTSGVSYVNYRHEEGVGHIREVEGGP